MYLWPVDKSPQSADVQGTRNQHLTHMSSGEQKYARAAQDSADVTRNSLSLPERKCKEGEGEDYGS